MATKTKLKSEIESLKNTIKWFKTQLEPHDCGWMYTTIDGIKHRIKVLNKQLKAHTTGKLYKEKHWSEV
jgi:hypothetical protein